MEAKIIFDTQNTSKEDIRSLIQMVREWELRTPRADVSVFFETKPEMADSEIREIFEGIYPKFSHLVEIPTTKPQVISLGTRAMVIESEIVGTCHEFALSIGQTDEAKIKRIEEAREIKLVRMVKG